MTDQTQNVQIKTLKDLLKAWRAIAPDQVKTFQEILAPWPQKYKEMKGS